VGSIAPLIGLFGTVWGIMHSFSAIAQAKDTSLAVRRAGHCRGAVCTAVGLVAAIPAVIAYNQDFLQPLEPVRREIGIAAVSLARKLVEKPGCRKSRVIAAP